MQIKVDASALGKTTWYEYAIRFFFGGMVTVVAGVIAKKFGPGIGGLFLAFPAIFPASATLIEKHESQKKEREGFEGTERGRQAASVDASGAALGSIGLLVFAFLVWKFVACYNPWLVLVSAALIWLIVSVLLWQIRKQS